MMLRPSIAIQLKSLPLEQKMLAIQFLMIEIEAKGFEYIGRK